MSTAITFHSILDEYRKLAKSERDKGDKFERLMQGYLQTDPQYASKFEHVWLWNEFPYRQSFGGNDTGIDIVCETHAGKFWAVQCKCFEARARIGKASVDSFLATSSRQFADETGINKKFVQRLWISTTNDWGKNALEAVQGQDPPFNRINLKHLEEAPIDWEKLEKGLKGNEARTEKKTLRPHQQEALNLTHQHFKKAERGQLIMACGTGKTFTSLKIAEKETQGNGLVLFLVPSIALLGQTLREWSSDAEGPIHPVCICSQAKISQKKTKLNNQDGYSIVDLALPATTNIDKIVDQLQELKDMETEGLKVVFSTYQSIEVISNAQETLLDQQEEDDFGIFDLIICDEAHRTTGVTLVDNTESSFVLVHDDSFIRAKRRLYMTATPRLYSDDSKSKAQQASAVICSMDDESKYGPEIYRIGFGQAVDQDLLSDYKVLILTVSENDIPMALQGALSDDKKEIGSDDASKLIGCINAMSKQILGDEGIITASDPNPMKRAVAFCARITDSKKITSVFNDSGDLYYDSLSDDQRSNMVRVQSQHVDGTMSAPERDEKLSWLKETQAYDAESRILTNVRCLSEGVDVPSLDAVMFLSARNSEVDVVQSVGRVMRKAPGKKYGYIIIPILVPANVAPSVALNDNKRYKVVWTVLNALRAHDDRFNATINKIDLNKRRPSNILVGRVGGGDIDRSSTSNRAEEPRASNKAAANAQLAMQFEQLQSALFARMVMKVGNKRYWEQWANDVAIIAERQAERINKLIESDGRHEKAFAKFLMGLQKNINPSISQQEAVEMLSQHIITKPVFEALFEGYSFVSNNPISKSMQTMLNLLEKQSLESDTETLQKFYASVKARAAGIDNAEGKQRIIIELYDKFFKTAFPKMVEKLGIVYTPVEVVDFIIHSVADVLEQEFGRSISDENVHILDPFTGTGTFITRLIQSGRIKQKDLARKYAKEIHANEIVLLAYYIAAVNIENAYHDQIEGTDNYKSFDGICLTDTFQLGESEDGEKLFSEMFPQNSERVAAQKKAPLRVIFGNPPYSVGQKSANDNAQNQSYPKLDSRISNTYVKETKATNKNSLYDSYIKAFRWSSDRLDKAHGGVICFVSNGAWIDGNSADGFRKILENEFSNIYVFNLRGNQRTSGELSRKEGGKIFGSGSRTPISITLLVKNPNVKNEKTTIHYHDIGDYLKREEKLKIISDFKSVSNVEFPWGKLKPNVHGDWINLRNDAFQEFISMAAKKDLYSFFIPGIYCRGLESGRDFWAYNSNIQILENNVSKSFSFFNEESQLLQEAKNKNSELVVKDFVKYDDSKISWSRAFLNEANVGKVKNYKKTNIVDSLYRPFFKQKLYFSRELNNVVTRMDSFFPSPQEENKIISLSGLGGSKDFSVIIANCIPDVQLQFNGQCFPLYYYEATETQSPGLFDASSESEYIRHDGVSDFILDRAHKIYGKKVNKEDIFYYVYGLLHSPDYRKTFSNDLKKMLPRLPLVDTPKDFWAFSQAGRDLADLHINYESVPPHPEVLVSGAESEHFEVQKLRYPKKGQTDTILYNSQITLSNIPARAYEYIVNGKSAVDWIIDRYQVKIDKKSGIKNDPNDWAKEVGNPRYILDLLLSVVNVSVQTVEIVEGLPEMDF